MRRPGRRAVIAGWIVGMAALLASATGCGSEDPDVVADDPVSELECEAAAFPCTWAEVSPDVARRTFELAAEGVELLARTGSVEAVAERIAADGDIGGIVADARAVRFWLEDGRPVWIAAPDTTTDETRGVTGSGGAGGVAPLQQQSSNVVVGPGRRDLGRSDPTKPAKRALVLSPFEWEFGDHAYTIQAMSSTPEYGCSGCIDDFQNGLPAKERLNPGPSARITPQVRIRHFEGWRNYDLIHVSTHGKMLCRTSATISIAGGRIGVTNQGARYDCIVGLSTGTSWPLTDFNGTVAPGFVTRGGGGGLSRLPGLPGVEFLFEGPHRSCGHSIDPVKQKALYDQLNCGSRVNVSTLLSDDFFRSTYPGGLKNKIIFLNACETMLQPNKTLADILISGGGGGSGGGSTAVLGWTISPKIWAAADVAHVFYNTLLRTPNGFSFTPRPPAGAAATVHVPPPGANDPILTAKEAADSTIKLLPFETRGLLAIGPGGTARGFQTPRRSSGATRSTAPAGSWGHLGRPEMRAREIIALLDPNGSEIQDGDLLRVRGQPGDGRPDSLELVFELRSIPPGDDPRDYRLRLYVDGVAANFDDHLRAADIRRRTGRRPFVVELGTDLARDQRVDLEPWVELPGDDGISRWVYEDLRVPPPCWAMVSWSGGRRSGTETLDRPAPGRYEFITGDLSGVGPLIQGAEFNLFVRLPAPLPALAPGSYTPERVGIGIETPSYGLQAGWALGDRFNPGPASVVIHRVAGGVVEGTVTAAMRGEIFATTPFDPNDPGPDVLNVTADFRYPLGSGRLADCPIP